MLFGSRSEKLTEEQAAELAVVAGDVMLVFDRGRSHTVPLGALQGFQGLFQSDDYGAYETTRSPALDRR